MPRLTRWMVRTSFVYLILALLTGLLLALREGAGWSWVPSGLAPAYIHLLVVGWVSMLIFGIVFWMFPKFTLAQPRGSTELGWVTYVLINAGLLLRVVGEAGISVRQGGAWPWILVASALLQLVGGLTFVTNTWRRVKEK